MMDNCTYGYKDWKNMIGQRVCAKGTMVGTLRYFGETSFSRGIWCGIELYDSLGKNDGTVCGVKYFTCKPNYGIFVPVSKVTKLCKDLSKMIEMPYVANQNKTFEIENSHAVFSVDNKISEELIASNDAVVESINETKYSLSKSLMDSEESLGILHSEEFENSWDSLLPDHSLSNFSMPSQVDMNYTQGPIFNHQSIADEKENIFSDKISYPKYASTPRHVMKTKSVRHVNDLKTNLSLDVDDTNQVFSDVLVQNNSTIHFDFDILKDNPHLSSTSETQLNFDFQIYNDEQSLSASKCTDSMGNVKNNLKTVHTFSKHSINHVVENDPLSKTFALVTPDSCTNIDESKKLQDKEIINKQINEKCDKKLNCTFNIEDLNLVKELNLNTTYELNFDCPTQEPYRHEKTVLADNLFDNVNYFNTSESIGQYVAGTELLDNVLIEKTISESCSVKDKLTSNLFNNENSDFNQKIKSPDNIFDNVLLYEESETKIRSNSSNERNALKEVSCISDKALKKNSLRKEGLYKNKFLKDLDKIEKSSRKSIPLLNSKKSINILNSDTIQLNSTFCLKNEKSNSEKAFLNRSRKRSSEDSAYETNEHKKFDFKKPFIPHPLVRPSKFVSQSQPCIDSKTKEYRQNSCLKETCNSKVSCDKSNFTSVKCNNKSLLGVKSKLPVIYNSKSLKLPVKTNKHLSCNLKAPKNLVNTIVLPLCKENKSTFPELYSTHCENTQSKFDSKSSLHSNDIYPKNRDVGNCGENNLSNNSKIVTQNSGYKVNNNGRDQFKIPVVLNANKSKLPTKFQTVTLPTEENKIRRRNTISSCSAEGLPVGIVKPRSSLSKPIKFINNEKSQSQKYISSASDNIENTDSKMKMFGYRAVQVPRNFKTDTSKRNS